MSTMFSYHSIQKYMLMQDHKRKLFSEANINILEYNVHHFF